MVRDGYFYALGLLVAAILVGWFARPAWAIVPLLLAMFFLWFFRDPEREIPGSAGAVVSRCLIHYSWRRNADTYQYLSECL
jgi:phosphatidylserine decarboxylase